MKVSTSSRRALRLSALALVLSGTFATPARADLYCQVWDPAANGGRGGYVPNMVADTNQGNEHGDQNTTCSIYASAYGRNNNASGPASAAVGYSNEAFGMQSSAFGSDNSAYGTASSAFGFAGTAHGFGSLVFAGWLDRNGDNLAYPDIDADGDGILDSRSETAYATGISSVALGAGVAALGDFSTAIGVNAQAQAANSTALGFGAVATEANTIAVGAVGGPMNRIVNMADGVAAHDAVNLSQLQAAITTANAYTDTAVATGGTAANAYTDNREAAIRGDMTTGDAQTLAASKAYADNKLSAWNDSFTQLQQQVDVRFAKTDARIDRNGAMGGAMAAAAMNTAGLPGQNRVGVGVGAQNGRAALAVGYQRMLTRNTSVSLTGAFAGGERSVAAGAGFSW